jgi:chromosome segregation ATPase
MTNLIERLRETASKGVSVWGDLQVEAADMIEALSSRNRQLVVESSKYCAEVSRGMSDTIRLMEERDALKAELNATEVLLEECKMDWSGDVTQLKAEHKHEVDTLRKRVAHLEVENIRLANAWANMQKAKRKAEESEREIWDERDTLRQQLAEAQRDAERYRWMRDNSASISWNPSRFNSEIVSGFAHAGTGYLGFNFEDAIKEAMKGTS